MKEMAIIELQKNQLNKPKNVNYTQRRKDLHSGWALISFHEINLMAVISVSAKCAKYTMIGKKLDENIVEGRKIEREDLRVS